MLPTASGGIAVDGETSRGADLATMRVAAEVEAVTELGRLPIGLRRVGEKATVVRERQTWDDLIRGEKVPE